MNDLPGPPESFSADVLDTFPNRIAVVDAGGNIVSVNAAWRNFAQASGVAPQQRAFLGASYLETCDRAAASQQSDAAAVASGLRAVLAGTLPGFSWEYPCYTPTETRWFRVRASPFGSRSGAVLVHEDITAQRRSEEALLASEERLRGLLENLRISEAKLRKLFEILPVGVSLLDPQGVIVETNPALEKILSIDRAGLAAGAYHGRRYVRADRTPLRPDEFPSQRAVREQRPIEPTVIGVEKEDGSLIWTEVSAAPAAIEGLASVVVTADITRRMEAHLALRNLERSRLEVANHLQSIVDGLPAMIGYWDNQLINRFANQAYLAWFGKSPEEILGQPIKSLLGERIYAANRPHIEGALRGEPQEFERQLTDASGKQRWSHTSYTPHVVDGEVRGFFVLVSDISEAKRTEAALRAAKEEADQATRAKGLFLANISHEIRTPMNGILGMTHLVLDSTLTPEQRERVGMIQESANNLMVLVNDLLDFERIEADQMSLEVAPVDLRGLVDGVVNMLALSAREKGLLLSQSVAPAVAPLVLGDAARLRQVVLNLVGNAIKFTDRGEVSVLVESDVDQGGETDAQRLRISVRDTGIGISPAQQTRIFEPFSQADESVTRRFGGTGLGLAICARLTRLMGGTIRVDSQEGRGSTFHVSLRLPLAPITPTSPSAGAPHPPSGLPPISPRRVLLVEDNIINQRIAKAMLGKRGHHVVLASNGQEAIELLAAGSFDVVLMDLQMPVMGGLDATKLIREQEKKTGGHVRIAAITAHSMASDRARCLEAGMDEYLSKPLNPERLFAFVEAPAG